MTVWQIELEEKVAEAIREEATQIGKTPEARLAEIAAHHVEIIEKTDAKDGQWKAAILRLVESARNSGGNSHGWKWNRDELYER
jgi:hypothetical protein